MKLETPVLACCAIALWACSHPREPATAADVRVEPAAPAPDVPNHLVATLRGTAQFPDLEGDVHLVRQPGGVDLYVQLDGLPPGRHAWHVHEDGDCSDPAGGSTGGHYDFAALGGDRAPGAHPIAGDLGDLDAGESGFAQLTDTVASLDARHLARLEGRAIVVHANANDPAQPDGAAGMPIACAVLHAAPPGTEHPAVEGTNGPGGPSGPTTPSRPPPGTPRVPPANPGPRPIPGR